MLGDRHWMNSSQGKLSFQEKMKFIQTVMLPASTSFIYSKIAKSDSQNNLKFRELKIPDTAIVKDAILELENTQSTEIIHHSWRCYFWGIAIAAHKQWYFDDENLLIASLMHDVGLANPKSEYSKCQCFTFESSLRSEILCEKHHYPIEKSRNISDAICLHMNGYLNENDPNISKESLLLQQATSCDVIGTNRHLLSASFQTEILNKYPNANFHKSMQELFQQESQRHPQARTALLSHLGLNLMIKLNKL